ncbi:MAG TPA: hypothetical protein VM490_07390 [Armatimonadaceae bacterium]|nr:hypothetical protein [Armatimonadaceae bacterium]
MPTASPFTRRRDRNTAARLLLAFGLITAVAPVSVAHAAAPQDAKAPAARAAARARFSNSGTSRRARALKRAKAHRASPFYGSREISASITRIAPA